MGSGLRHYGYYAYPNSGEIKLDTKVKDAAVFINGAYAGTTHENKSMHLRPGSYNIEIREAGQTDTPRRSTWQPARRCTCTPSSNAGCQTGSDQNWMGAEDDAPMLNTPESFTPPAPVQKTARKVRKGYVTLILIFCPGAFAADGGHTVALVS